YNAQIKALLRTGSRRRYIDRTTVRKIGNAVHLLITSAQQHLNSGNYRSAMLISCAVLEEMTKALEFVDDSNGDIGINIRASYDILAELTGLPSDENLRRELFQYCTLKFKLREFEGWDWHIGMMDLAVNLQRDPQEAELIYSLLDEIPLSGYEKEKAQEIRLILMGKLQGEEEAQKFLEQHLNLTRFRVLAIDKAFKENEYEKVKQLAFDGIQQHKKSKPGLLSDWYNALINVAIAEGEHAKVLEYAFLQLTDHGRDKKAYVEIIRKYTPADEWPAKFESLIMYLISSQHWQYRELIPELLVEEQDWKRLFSFLTNELYSNDLSFEGLLHYGQYLLKDYGDKLSKVYEQELDRYAISSSKRSEYKALIKYLRQLKKMGFGEMVNRLVTTWKTTYRYRPSMMEELQEM
ncbi:MAG: hypothetical protein M3R25_14495, partial [Bacteroidota bacterium]|nr:hypothetical protein [Bacteroidota bacterium]